MDVVGTGHTKVNLHQLFTVSLNKYTDLIWNQSMHFILGHDKGFTSLMVACLMKITK